MTVSRLSLLGKPDLLTNAVILGEVGLLSSSKRTGIRGEPAGRSVHESHITNSLSCNARSGPPERRGSQTWVNQ